LTDLEVAKLTAEVDKLRAEVASLQALDPFSRVATAWLAAGGTLVAGAVGALITWAVRRTGEQKLQQERELGREQHNLRLFQDLGNGSRAAASVLLDRLKRLHQRKRLDDVEAAEPSLIKNVLIAALKAEQPRPTIQQPIGIAISDGSVSPPSLNSPPSGVDPALCKYIADELVNTLSARFLRGRRPEDIDGHSPLGQEFQKCILREVFWADVDARGVDFYASDLSEASLRGAALQRAKFYEATMVKAVLEEADLTLANLGGARLGSANLKKANLSRANLQGADLTGADLDGADMSEAVYNTERLQQFQATQWPTPDFNPALAGAKLMNELYRPERISRKLPT
jgi:hypothetical protein